MSHHTHGLPEAAPATKTIFNTWHHPLNPSYTTVQKVELKMLPKYGYALVEEELPTRELDDEILSKENEILQQRLLTDESSDKVSFPVTKRKPHQSNKLSENDAEIDVNSNYMDDNNNNSELSSAVKRNKSSLNAVETELSSLSSCPGLATAAVSYKLD